MTMGELKKITTVSYYCSVYSNSKKRNVFDGSFNNMPYILDRQEILSWEIDYENRLIKFVIK